MKKPMQFCIDFRLARLYGEVILGRDHRPEPPKKTFTPSTVYLREIQQAMDKRKLNGKSWARFCNITIYKCGVAAGLKLWAKRH